MKTEKKTGSARTQLAVRDEWWSDERIQSFLELETSTTESKEFHLLSKAYQGMIPEAFDRFIEFFIAAGFSVNDQDNNSQTILSIATKHKNSEEYCQILVKAGAT